jgi:hypothetical protein
MENDKPIILEMKNKSLLNGTNIIKINSPTRSNFVPVTITHQDNLLEPKNGTVIFYVQSDWSYFDLSEISDIKNNEQLSVYGGSVDSLSSINLEEFIPYKAEIKTKGINLAYNTQGIIEIIFNNQNKNLYTNNYGIYHLKFISLYDTKIILPTSTTIISDNTQVYEIGDWHIIFYDITMKLQSKNK